MLKAGVLYPRSTIYPLLGADFLSGIKSLLSHNKCEEKIRLITEPVGFGTSEKEVYQVIEKLLLHEEADLVIAFLDLKVIPVVQPLFTATGKLLLVVNPGANYPENWVPAPGTFYLTLLDSFLCRLTGMLASNDGITQSIMAASFYDGGYQHCNAMVNGFVRSGSTIQYNFISQQKPEEFDITPLQEFLSARQELQSMLCLYSGKEANLFYQKVNSMPEADSLQLYVSPMMLEEQNCSGLENEMRFAVHGYIPWHSNLSNDANTIFKTAVSRQSNRVANVFSLLGWEAGLILNLFMKNNIPAEAPGKMVNALHSEKIKSPRGYLQTDAATNYFIGPVYKASLQKDNTVLVNETMEDTAPGWNLFVKEENGVPASGWLNTYLCY